MSAVTADRLRELRMLSHRLTGVPHSDVVTAVRAQLATQAQLLAGACWSVAQRTTDATEAEVRAALAEGRIIQTWPMRGTLHLVAPEDVRWLLALLPPRMHGNALTTIWRKEGLERADFERARELVTAHLEGGRTASRKHLLEHLTANGVDATGGRGSHLIRFLAETATLVIGPAHGTTQTFALLDDRVPSSPPLDREDALGRLAARYVAGHGPMTDRDLAWWSRLTLTDARAALEVAADRLAAVECDDITYWVDPQLLDDTANRAPARPAHLLGAFDEYQLGYSDRSLIIDNADLPLIAPKRNGVFAPMVLQDGRLVGTWSSRVAKSTVDVTVAPFPELPRAALMQQLSPEAARYARYLGVTEREFTLG